MSKMKKLLPRLYALAAFVVVAFADDAHISCGSAIKITSVDTGYHLNSEEKNLGTGSGQQLVTFIMDGGSHNTLWWVRPAHNDDDREYPPNASCQLAEPVKCGGTIRLTHVNTMRNLHSHEVKSPLSNQQEVTGYGQGDAKGDAGDNWKVDCSGEFWTRDENFRLVHVDTGKFLGTSKSTQFNEQTCGRNCPIMGHLESFARRSADKYTELTVHQGIHLSY